VDAVVVFPEQGNLFYRALAQRVVTAASECGIDVELRAAGDLGDGIAGCTALLVNPSECALSGEPFVSGARAFGTRIAVLAESVDTRWYRNQLATGVSLDAILDVGFVEQTAVEGPPYGFVFNGPTGPELAAIEAHAPGARPIPWSFVGHRTDERVSLAARLVAELAPGGFVFLPRSKRVRAGGGTLDPAAVTAVLEQSEIYVWESHHSHLYYESFRFVDALVAGAAPGKIDARHAGAFEIPNVFETVAELAHRDARTLYDDARAWYLTRPTLAQGLEPALASVLP